MAAILARRWMKPIARLTIGLLLFAQLMASVQACAPAQPSPAHAFSDEMACPDCPGMDSGQNLCLASYLQDSQASRAFDNHRASAPWAPIVRAHASDPPLQILFCSYQT
jgi:hypothetical protein